MEKQTPAPISNSTHPKINRTLLSFLAVAAVLFLYFFINNIVRNPSNISKEQVEKYFEAHMNRDDNGLTEKEIPVCSYFSFGGDKKYLYGFVTCNGLTPEADGGPFLSTLFADPVRITHSPFKGITGYERPTSECQDCSGIKVQDLFPAQYAAFFESDGKFPIDLYKLHRENLKKMFSGKPITEKVGLLLVKEDINANGNDLARGYGYPNGNHDAVGSENSGWDVAVYLDYSGPDANKSNVAAVCRHIDPEANITPIGLYQFSEDETAKKINPTSCLPEGVDTNEAQIIKKDWKISFIKPSGWMKIDADNKIVLKYVGVQNEIGDTMTIQYVSGDKITDTSGKFGPVTYYFDTSTSKWMRSSPDERTGDATEIVVPAVPILTINGLLVFSGTSSWLTYIIPLSHTTFLKLNISGSGNTQPLTDLLRTIKKI